MVKNALSKLSLLLMALSLWACHSSDTTVVIIEDPPVQTYTIYIDQVSAVNPVGDVNVEVVNAYDSDSTAISGTTLSIFDRGDNLPITFSIVDSVSTIYQSTITLTDFLDADNIVLEDQTDADNNIHFRFGIVLQTKKIK